MHVINNAKGKPINQFHVISSFILSHLLFRHFSQYLLFRTHKEISRYKSTSNRGLFQCTDSCSLSNPESSSTNTLHGTYRRNHLYLPSCSTIVFNRCQKHHNSHLLTTWNRVLLEKLTGFQLVEKFPTFNGSRKFITVLTSARHLSLY